MSWDEAHLGVDGNAGFAMVAPDLQEGEAEFVVIKPLGGSTANAAAYTARQALEKLKTRLKWPVLGYLRVPRTRGAGAVEGRVRRRSGPPHTQCGQDLAEVGETLA
jgi:hypothetical protein